jgi:hypothetical protein
MPGNINLPFYPPFMSFMNPNNPDSQKYRENFLRLTQATGFNFDEQSKQQGDRININNFNISKYVFNKS